MYTYVMLNDAKKINRERVQAQTSPWLPEFDAQKYLVPAVPLLFLLPPHSPRPIQVPTVLHRFAKGDKLSGACHIMAA